MSESLKEHMRQMLGLDWDEVAKIAWQRDKKITELRRRLLEANNTNSNLLEVHEARATKLTHYEAVGQMQHIAIYAPHSFCEVRGCGYGNRHGDKWMLSVGTPGEEWKYKVHYYDSFAELAENLTAQEAQDD